MQGPQEEIGRDPGVAAIYTLPFPPTVNNLFSGRQKRYTSKTYRRWKAQAGLAILAQKRQQGAAPDRVSVRIRLTPPDRRQRDAGNYEKAVMDLLVATGIIEDDRAKYVREVTIGWTDEVRAPGSAIVTLAAA
ncbi:MAG: RusA family crossover junction endodeoxyribonuclease [Anaerolineae bacterium]|nr:RusA family crossover junction endodeoxyribonuclease [Anaerolineae bacterium]